MKTQLVVALLVAALLACAVSDASGSKLQKMMAKKGGSRSQQLAPSIEQQKSESQSAEDAESDENAQDEPDEQNDASVKTIEHSEQTSGGHYSEEKEALLEQSREVPGVKFTADLPPLPKDGKYSFDWYKKAARIVAPKIYMAKGETSLPDDPAPFAKHMKMEHEYGKVAKHLGKDHVGTCIKKAFTPFMATFTKCMHNKYKWLSGQDPSTGKVPTYVIVRPINKERTIVDVQYWIWYPYNEGKRVCIGVEKKVMGKRRCFGKRTPAIGSHIGDWEHATIRFENHQPKQLYVSVHAFGDAFALAHSDPTPRFRGNVDIEMPAPKFEGSHPILYSAKGSHGTWTRAGYHVYHRIKVWKFEFDLLADVASKGKPMDTWKNMVFTELHKPPKTAFAKGWKQQSGFDAVLPTTPYEGKLAIFNNYGRWGPNEAGCGVITKISGECLLNPGPSGPTSKSFQKKAAVSF